MLKLGCNKRLSINKKGCKSRVKSMLFSSENAFFLVVLRPSYTRTTAVERVVWWAWYTSNDGCPTSSLQRISTSVMPLYFYYSSIIEYKKGKQRLMKTFCLPWYSFFYFVTCCIWRLYFVCVILSFSIWKGSALPFLYYCVFCVKALLFLSNLFFLCLYLVCF